MSGRGKEGEGEEGWGDVLTASFWNHHYYSPSSHRLQSSVNLCRCRGRSTVAGCDAQRLFFYLIQVAEQSCRIITDQLNAFFFLLRFKCFHRASFATRSCTKKGVFSPKFNNPQRFVNKQLCLVKQTLKQPCLEEEVLFISIFMLYFVMFYLSLSNHFVGISNAYKSYCGGD